MLTSIDLIAILPWLILTVSAGVILLVEVFAPVARRAIDELTLLALAGAAWTRLAFPLPGEVWSGALQVDAVTRYVDLYVMAALFLVVWMSGPFLRRTEHEGGEFYSLLLLSGVGAMVMASASDLLPLFLGLEVLSIPLYVLNAYFRRLDISIEAGLKYFVVGAFASGFVVYGMALLYGTTATTSLAGIASAVRDGVSSPLLMVGAAMVIGALGFKLALFPFHAWAPDVYQGSPTPVTAFLSVVPKGAALVVLVRLVQALGLDSSDGSWLWAAGIIAVGSQTLGNIVAIVQRDIKRMLAYSGIAHMGYAMVAVIVAGQEGATAVLLYLAAYTVMNIGAFAVVALLSERENEPHLLGDLSGQGWVRPLPALALTVCLLSLAGVPPLIGFTAKFLVFRAAVNAGLIWLAVLGVLNSVISAFYYLRVVYVMYMQPLPKRKPKFAPSFAITASAAVAALLVVGIGVYPGPLMAAARIAAQFLAR